MLDIRNLKSCLIENRLIYSRHSLIEMKTEELGRIYEKDIEEALLSGEIIKQYPEDRPYPSVLVSGFSSDGRPVHIVCAYHRIEDLTLVVTAYRPDPRRWIDHKTRRP